MTDKCKHCGRPTATIETLNADEDGLLCGRGLRLGKTDSLEMYGECCAHEAHVLRMRLLQAESLLNGVSMLSFMGAEYRDKHLSRIDEFLKDGELAKLMKQHDVSTPNP